MNKERLLLVLDHIKKHPETYDQRFYRSPCGTKYCIAGHAISMFLNKELTEFDWSRKVFRRLEAAHLLGLNEMQANYIFDERRTIGEIEEYIL